MQASIARIEASLDTIAELYAADPTYEPVYLRLEEELDKAMSSRPDPRVRAQMRVQRNRSKAAI
jgi:hypothetical protein